MANRDVNEDSGIISYIDDNNDENDDKEQNEESSKNHIVSTKPDDTAQRELQKLSRALIRPQYTGHIEKEGNNRMRNNIITILIVGAISAALMKSPASEGSWSDIGGSMAIAAGLTVAMVTGYKRFFRNINRRSRAQANMTQPSPADRKSVV